MATTGCKGRNAPLSDVESSNPFEVGFRPSTCLYPLQFLQKLKIMQLTSLSWQPNRPCILLHWPSVTVLLDCAVDISTLSSFMPVKLPRLSNFSSYNATHTYLKRYGDEVFVDGSVEVHPTVLDYVSLDTVDVILVSNCMSLFALPFMSEKSGFRGLIYTTGPVLELGRLMGLEFIDFIESDDRSSAGDEWKKFEIFNNFPNKPTTSPQNWKSFYTREQFETALKKVDTVSYHDMIDLHGIVKITAYSSGYSIGACNWTILTETEKVVYVSASSSRTSHMKAADWDQFRAADAMILTSISRFPDLNPETSVCNVCAVAVDTLKKNGSVLMPVSPVGTVYDLLEVIAHQMDQQNVSQDVPIYFISPIAKETLAFSSISMEWLSEKKQECFYVPDQAFAHGRMLKNGRLKVYNTSHGAFSRQMRTPCVIFCGHPSLRLGDAIHFLEMWGRDARNAIIMTDPDYPLGDVYGPYRNLAIRAFFYPIDTRLDYMQLNSAIIPDLAPKLILMPDIYSRPPPACPQRLECAINYDPKITFRVGETLNVPSIMRRKRVSLTPEYFPEAVFRAPQGTNGLGLASLDGFLSAFDNNFVLKVPISLERFEKHSYTPVETTVDHFRKRPKLVGSYSLEILQQRLCEVDPHAVMRTVDGGKTLHLPSLGADVRVMDDGFRTQIICESGEGRQKIFEAVSLCLKQLCSA
ncbi:unnamed protein product [Enterobius vermicularis]|uniref:Beta-Casp domain-containing protein n=1 Tax=Enterobius vermicularis TaxID=51028 RepID=A0A0N4UX21_ENTVE|nr:unnamed protein product [Enterobius vermicularis]